MNRRRFVKTTLAAGVAATFPVLSACGEKAKVATEAETSLRAVSLDGAEIELEKAAIRELGESLAGPIILSESPDYDGARKIWNGMHDRRPALIARCLSNEDVANAVAFARDRNLLTAVRGGGHSWPGKSVCDDGLMIDLSQLTSVSVDTDTRRALVGGGALLGHLDTASLEKGLVTTAGVVSHTGVGGFTLGGGYGRLNRKYGLAVDNLRSATLITADGRVRNASAHENDDLFWAIRGGGGNFGVVTQFEFELYPFDRNLLSGNIVWPIAQARDVLEFYAEWSPGLSDDLYTGPAMLTMPDGTEVILVEVVYAGDPAVGEKEMAPLRALGTPLDDGIKMQDYTVMQTQEDAAFAHGIRSYAKNGMVKEYTQELVDTIIESFVADPRMAMFTHTAGGAMNRVDDTDTAFPHRNAETMLSVGGGWTDPAMDEEAMAIGRSWFARLAPFTGGYYDNIQSNPDAVASNYGPAYERLVEIKTQYDPGNLFRLNSNIEPA
jgi:FAD/FMN-containing dehydrogenase